MAAAQAIMAELLAVEEGETGTRRRLMIELAATAKSLSLGMDGGMEGWRGRFGEDADRVMGWTVILYAHTHIHVLYAYHTHLAGS